MAETKTQIESRLRAENPQIIETTVTITDDGDVREDIMLRGVDRDAKIAAWVEYEQTRQLREEARAAEQAAVQADHDALKAINDDLKANRPLTPVQALALNRIVAAQALRQMGP